MGKVEEKTEAEVKPIPKSKVVEDVKDKVKKEAKKAKEEQQHSFLAEEEPQHDPFLEISKDMNLVFKELTMITDWVAELETKLNKVARRIGL
tara:strand:- start:1634 stop:1909 length:276 start_codon:yes stop_codon:yes gene_type:complete